MKIGIAMVGVVLAGCTSLTMYPNAQRYTLEQFNSLKSTGECRNGNGCVVLVRPALVGTGDTCKVYVEPVELDVYGKSADLTWDMDNVYWVGGWVFEANKGVSIQDGRQFKDNGRKWTGGKYFWNDTNDDERTHKYAVTVHNTLTGQRCSVDPTIVNKG